MQTRNLIFTGNYKFHLCYVLCASRKSVFMAMSSKSYNLHEYCADLSYKVLLQLRLHGETQMWRCYAQFSSHPNLLGLVGYCWSMFFPAPAVPQMTFVGERFMIWLANDSTFSGQVLYSQYLTGLVKFEPRHPKSSQNEVTCCPWET